MQFLEALYSVGRIENRRYSIVELSGRCRLVKESINALYESAVGGTVVLKLQDMKFEDEGMLISLRKVYTVSMLILKV